MDELLDREGEFAENKDRLMLQIDDLPPFTPELIRQVGTVWGYVETTQPDDQIKNGFPVSSVSVMDYVKDNKERTLYFKYGEWKEVNGQPCFCGRELLMAQPENYLITRKDRCYLP